MSDQVTNVYGMKIGGSVGPNDRVGVHVQMPTQPGVCLSIDVNNELDGTLRQILDTVSMDDPKQNDIKKMIEEILAEQNQQTKFDKVRSFIEFGASVVSIAANVITLKQYLPQ